MAIYDGGLGYLLYLKKKALYHLFILMGIGIIIIKYFLLFLMQNYVSNIFYIIILINKMIILCTYYITLYKLIKNRLFHRNLLKLSRYADDV